MALVNVHLQYSLNCNCKSCIKIRRLEPMEKQHQPNHPNSTCLNRAHPDAPCICPEKEECKHDKGITIHGECGGCDEQFNITAAGHLKDKSCCHPKSSSQADRLVDEIHDVIDNSLRLKVEMSSHESQEWEREFDKLELVDMIAGEDWEKIKSFISNLLEREKDEKIDAIRYGEMVRQEERTRLIGEIEENLPRELAWSSEKSTNEEISIALGFKMCLEKVKQILANYKK